MTDPPTDTGTTSAFISGDEDRTRPRIGVVAVFAGDWAFIDTPAGPRVPVGFVGTLIARWHGAAVFTCTRQVAAAIVADQRRLREQERAQLSAAGVDPKQTAELVDDAYPAMFFDGDDLVVNEGDIGSGDPVTRIRPRSDGTYVVNGWSWTWIEVDPAICDRIAGVLTERPPQARSADDARPQRRMAAGPARLSPESRATHPAHHR